MLNEIIALYAIADDLLKALGHREDSRTTMSDAEVTHSPAFKAGACGVTCIPQVITDISSGRIRFARLVLTYLTISDRYSNHLIPVVSICWILFPFPFVTTFGFHNRN